MRNYKLKPITYDLTIGWLYPDLMSTYGDRGNIIVLEKRCQWRGIKAQVKRLDLGFKTEDLRKCDLIFMGGAQDKQQKIVAKDLTEDKVNELKNLIEEGIPGLFICGAYQFLGNYYKEADGTIIEGLKILDLYTESAGKGQKRLIGDLIIQSHKLEVNSEKLTFVGFENHGGRTYLGKEVLPFGKVLSGFGNNDKDKTEGAVYKNIIGTYLHGPALPKNPNLADYLIKKALEKKYSKKIELKELDDNLELKAHKAIANKYAVKL